MTQKADSQGLLPKTEGFNQSSYQQKSTFTLLIYFRNGYTKGMKFHSFKQEERKIAGVYIKDQRYAFNRLMNLIEVDFINKYKTAIIYHNETNTEVCTFAYNQCKSRIPLHWETKDNGDVVFVLKEIVVKNMQERMMKLQDTNFYKY
jgi:hypothetical protein